MVNTTNIAANLETVQQRIACAAKTANRQPADIQLLAVSKTKPINDIETAWQAGQRAFAENYLQEALEKINALQHTDIIWHFIGHIQSNKTRAIAENFHWVHTVDCEKIAKRLHQQRPAHLPALNICLQVNINDEASKFGVTLQQLPDLAKAIINYPNLKLRGLMAIPEANTYPAEQLANFQQLTAAQAKLNESGLNLDTLSMGMSQDLETAIAAGSTLVRVGTAIFGKRSP